jgi:hypothetical protein
MAYAVSLAKLFAQRRDRALPVGFRPTAREAARRLGTQLDGLHDDWLAQAGTHSRERAMAMRAAIDGVRTAVTHTLHAVTSAGVEREPDRPLSEPALARLLRLLYPPATGGATQAADPEPAPAEVHPVRLLDAVGHALEALDRAFEAVAAEPRPLTRWDEDPDLLDVLHGLLAAQERGSAELALGRIGLLRDKVRLQRDIEVVSYDAEDPEHDERLFDFTAPAAPALPGSCHAPALVTHACVLRRGIVHPLPFADKE